MYLDDKAVTGATLEEHDKNLKLLLDAADECNLTLNETKSKFRTTTLDMLGCRISHNQVKPDPQRLQPLLDLPPPSTGKELKRVSGMFLYYSKWISKFSEKASPLQHASTFPLDDDSLNSFQRLKDDLVKACLGVIADDLPFEVETDASDFVLAAIVTRWSAVAFMSRTLTSCERRYPAVEKEACARIEAVCRWKHYLKGRHFSQVTHQQTISYMFDQNHKGKINNTKILSWRLELTQFSYVIGPELTMLRLMRFHEFALQRLTLVPVRNCRICTSLLATQAMLDGITLFVNGIYRFRAKKRKVSVGTAKRAQR